MVACLCRWKPFKPRLCDVRFEIPDSLHGLVLIPRLSTMKNASGYRLSFLNSRDAPLSKTQIR